MDPQSRPLVFYRPPDPARICLPATVPAILTPPAVAEDAGCRDWLGPECTARRASLSPIACDAICPYGWR